MKQRMKQQCGQQISYRKRMCVKTPVAGTTPRLIEVSEKPLTAMVYDGKLVENPEKYLKRAPSDSADIQKTIEGMSAAELREMPTR